MNVTMRVTILGIDPAQDSDSNRFSLSIIGNREQTKGGAAIHPASASAA